jgi:hypothetical protein
MVYVSALAISISSDFDIWSKSNAKLSELATSTSLNLFMYYTLLHFQMSPIYTHGVPVFVGNSFLS